MLKGWNRKVRITSAISRAWTTTRMVSPKPLSDFVPDVTLIAFPIPASRKPARWQNVFPKGIVRRFAQENDLWSDVESGFRCKTRIRPGSIVLTLRRFRRLFAGAQSRAVSKTANPLRIKGFLVLSRPGRVGTPTHQDLPGRT